ncbi:serine endopeptidase [Delftia sp. PS-11]|uniref:serine endopeptidase n=1 Tax=Delftia sp. PS-11 TaxID=2767222 RepID=UPI002458F7DF|nr:serine endopeptidase [Delftia sp. PS-11]KAJ8746167.1 serine endopeptidase [Delftia sp. PS-11]
MSKALRLPEKWFRRGLWLVAVIFASFLIGLGGLVVGDLPQVESPRSVEDFMAPAQAEPVKAEIQSARAEYDKAGKALESANLKHGTAQARYQSARETFDNWVATRKATARPDQDSELIARTRALDALKQEENASRAAVEQLQESSLQARQRLDAANQRWSELRDGAVPAWRAEMRAIELRVFLLRLAVTLPLLLVAGWLFARQRKSTWWPFVWGFIFFALFAFFVELVPYLPDYGGYVRYVVGIVVTVLLGRAAILALNRYLERQKQQESLPETQRREELGYDVALARLAKGVCPGCERSVDLKDAGIDFCPHCGIGLFDRCGQCSTRKSAFSRFCHACGTPARAGECSASPAADGHV